MKKLGTIEEIMEAFEECAKERQELEQENKQLKEKLKLYEEPDDMALMFMWCDEKAKDKIKELQDKIDKAIEEIKTRTDYEVRFKKLLGILGDKENE